MPHPLTYDSILVRPVVVPLRRKVVARVGSFAEWPLILVDMLTREGVVGLAYLEPYLASAMASMTKEVVNCMADS